MVSEQMVTTVPEQMVTIHVPEQMVTEQMVTTQVPGQMVTIVPKQMTSIQRNTTQSYHHSFTLSDHETMKTWTQKP